MTNVSGARNVHLVGSVPLNSSEEVFAAVGEALGGVVKRFPDGETGLRKDWILFQGNKLQSAKNVVVVGHRELRGGTTRPMLDLVPGTTEADLSFGPLGYAEAALQSYEAFKRLRSAGRIPTGTRMQVSLPTPLATSQGFFERASVPIAWSAYEKRILEEVAEIGRAIPHGDLAIQWDVCYEIVRNLEPEISYNQFTSDEIIAAVARVSEAVPAGAELGFHLCYGDLAHKHFIDPKDTSLVAQVANRLTIDIKRPINWMHFPVPRDRTDDAYFAPLRDLKLRPETEIYVGLIHFTDGLPGAKARIAAAQKFLPKFGVATECGFGRRAPETIRPLLELHREVARLV